MAAERTGRIKRCRGSGWNSLSHLHDDLASRWSRGTCEVLEVPMFRAGQTPGDDAGRAHARAIQARRSIGMSGRDQEQNGRCTRELL